MILEKQLVFSFNLFRRKQRLNSTYHNHVNTGNREAHMSVLRNSKVEVRHNFKFFRELLQFLIESCKVLNNHLIFYYFFISTPRSKKFSHNSIFHHFHNLTILCKTRSTHSYRTFSIPKSRNKNPIL